MLSDDSFIRYNRQIRVDDFGGNGQIALDKSRVLVIGAGGLGSAAALYLAGAGVGNLVIADGDTVDNSNLQRQVIYREQHQKQNKATAAVEQLTALNSMIKVRAVTKVLNDVQLRIEVSMADIILDCSDNFTTRYAVNSACFEHKKVLISGSASQWKGQLVCFDFRQKSPSCYQCLFPHTEQDSVTENCRSKGIIGAVVGIMGTLQALQAIKIITNSGDHLFSQLHTFDGLTMQWQRFNLPINTQCPICNKEEI